MHVLCLSLRLHLNHVVCVCRRWVLVLGAVLGSTTLVLVSGLNRTLGISDEFFVLGDSAMLTVLGQVGCPAFLCVHARMCYDTCMYTNMGWWW